MTIAIIGAGAIGGSLAGYLIQSKQDVTLIDFFLYVSIDIVE